MPKEGRPRHGSMAYWHRKRALSEVPHFNSWPDGDEGPKLQGFAGYKAGMTHAFVVDYRPTSTTAGQEVQVPVTVIECPPMKVAAVRFYGRTYEGLQSLGEVWADKLDEELSERAPVAKKAKGEEQWKGIDLPKVEDVRALTYTQPTLVTGIPKKVPELMETRIGGGTIEQRIAYGRSILGKEVRVTDFAKEGAIVDVAAVTKGKGFQGPTKRFGIKLLSHKNSKHRRGVGTLGSFQPGYVRGTVPNGGQMGYHQRTEYNKRLLKVGEDGDDVTPNGGFLHYGKVRNPYVIVHGSVPGPTKRLIRLRDAARPQVYVKLEKAPELSYISKESKQGV
ncbi:MAG: 50S ribosomal protein L3 [Methanobacteriota archaeon]|nr:MAG: 50S ribosomal protein L3 [Euryarchaeota archaeon]